MDARCFFDDDDDPAPVKSAVCSMYCANWNWIKGSFDFLAFFR